MGLTSTIITDDWAAAAFGAWSALCNAQISISEPATKTYNSETGTYDTVAGAVLYSGTARVQVSGNLTPQRDDPPGLNRRTQVYQFQIPRNSVQLNDTLVVTVTDGGLQSYLEDQEFGITSYFNSSDSFEQTFLATANTARQ